MECRLKRVNTPHYAKGFRLHNVNATLPASSSSAAATGDGARSSAAFQTNPGGTRKVQSGVVVVRSVPFQRLVCRRLLLLLSFLSFFSSSCRRSSVSVLPTTNPIFTNSS